MKWLWRGSLVIRILLTCSLLAGCAGHIEESENTGVDSMDIIAESKEMRSTDAEPVDIIIESEEMEGSATTSEASDTDAADSSQIDEKWMQIIEENVPLAEDEAYEKFEWVEGRTDCLRVWIKYKDEPVRDHFWHKSDYFLFVTEDGEVYDKLYVDYDITYEKDGSEWEYADSLLVRRTAGYTATFSAYFEDVTGDGHEDLLIHLDYVGPHAYYQACVYVYQDGTYVYVPGFEGVMNPYVDENGVLWSVCQTSAITSVETQYEYQNGEFVPVSSQNYEWSEEVGNYIPVQWSEEERDYVPVDDPTIRRIFDHSETLN